MDCTTGNISGVVLHYSFVKNPLVHKVGIFLLNICWRDCDGVGAVVDQHAVLRISFHPKVDSSEQQHGFNFHSVWFLHGAHSYIVDIAT